jgi:predicted AAA+ superfamily ATPase
MVTQYLNRALRLADQLGTKSVILLGPRQVGKSSLIRYELSPTKVFNLLKADTFQDLLVRPSIIREGIKEKGELIVIDEIQKLPSLMDEVHAMIEEHGVRFLLTGSSARKFTRSHTKMMGGRARTMYLHPFSYSELPEFDLTRALTFGTIPSIYFSADPRADIRSYVGDYIREEIMAEGLSRRVDQFSRFLETAAVSHTQELNFEEIGRDSQVPARTVRDYFSILADTLFGEVIFPFKKHPTRKATAHGKFFFFDISVPHALNKVSELSERSALYGQALEHLIFRELRTYRDYRATDLELTFYRDSSKREIDFLINGEIGIEVKSSTLVQERDIATLEEIGAEIPLRRRIVVSQDRHWRKLQNTEVWPVLDFLKSLWAGEIV